jgi:hypothetical protein
LSQIDVGRKAGGSPHNPLESDTNLLEGINNDVKVIKGAADGSHGDEYCFLKLRATFPCIPG